MIRLLDRYILKTFAMTWTIAFVCMVGLWVVADLMLNVDEFAKGDPGGWQIFWRIVSYYRWHLLDYFRYLAPLITVVAAGFTLARLQRSNELTPILAGGTSAYRVILPIVVGGLAVILVLVLVQELAIPACRDRLNRDRDYDGVDPSYPVRLLKEGPYRIDCREVHPESRELTAAEVIDLLYGPPGLPPPPAAAEEDSDAEAATRPVEPAAAPSLRPDIRIVYPRLYRGRRVEIHPHATIRSQYTISFTVGQLGVDDHPVTRRIDVSDPRNVLPQDAGTIENFRNVVVAATMPRRRPMAINLLDDHGRFVMLPCMDQPHLIVRDESGRFDRLYSADVGVWWEGRGPADPDRQWHWDNLRLGEDPERQTSAAAAASRPAVAGEPAATQPAARQVDVPVALRIPPGELELRSNHQWLSLLSLAELVHRTQSPDYRDDELYVILHFRVAMWFFSVILLLLGLPLLMNVDRQNLFVSGLYATVLTVGAYVLYFILQQMASNMPVAWVMAVAWLPIFAFAAVAAALLQAVRT